MKISFEQLFYGRGERGYGILGTSPGGRAFAARVESLCGAVGTPSGDYGGEPFLLSAPEGEYVIMLCGRRGAPDSMGRSTLFFQALVARKAELEEVKADAFSLFLQGTFVDKMPTGDIDELSIDVKSDRVSAPLSRLDVSLPCVFRSEKPLQDSVCAAVGERLNDISWTTFAFQFLPGFDIQVLPRRVQGLQAANEYDASGKLVYSAAAMNSPQKEEKVNCGKEWGAASHYSNDSYESLPEKSNAMLKFSIVANLVLVAVCAVLLVSRKSMSDSPAIQTEQIVVTNYVERLVEKQVMAKLSPEQKAEIIASYRLGLAEKFQANYIISIRDFKENEMVKQVEKDYNAFPTNQRYRSQKDFCEKLGKYINFVNEKILKGKTP